MAKDNHDSDFILKYSEIRINERTSDPGLVNYIALGGRGRKIKKFVVSNFKTFTKAKKYNVEQLEALRERFARRKRFYARMYESTKNEERKSIYKTLEVIKSNGEEWCGLKIRKVKGITIPASHWQE